MKTNPTKAMSAVFDGVEVELFIDLDRIMRRLGSQAAKSKGGRSQFMRGAIVAKRKRKPTFKNLEALFKL